MIITQDMNDKLINDVVYENESIIAYLDGFDILNNYFDVSVHDYQVYTKYNTNIDDYTEYILQYINSTRVVYSKMDLIYLCSLLVELQYQNIQHLSKDSDKFHNFIDDINYNLKYIDFDKSVESQIYDSTYRHKLELIIWNFFTKIHNEFEEEILNSIDEFNLFDLIDNYECD